MASRHTRGTSIGEYFPFEVHAAASQVRLPITQTSTTPILDYGHGVYLGSIVINDYGTAGSWNLIVYNGNPTAGGVIAANIKPTTNVTLDMNCVLDQGLYYTVTAGTGTFSATLNVLPAAV